MPSVPPPPKRVGVPYRRPLTGTVLLALAEDRERAQEQSDNGNDTADQTQRAEVGRQVADALETLCGDVVLDTVRSLRTADITERLSHDGRNKGHGGKADGDAEKLRHKALALPEHALKGVLDVHCGPPL